MGIPMTRGASVLCKLDESRAAGHPRGRKAIRQATSITRQARGVNMLLLAMRAYQTQDIIADIECVLTKDVCTDSF